MRSKNFTLEFILVRSISNEFDIERVLFFLVLHLVFNDEVTDRMEEEFDCPTGVMLVENKCNECYCTNSGELACTIRKCSYNVDESLDECEEGFSWRVGCNKCWCIAIGTICTNTTCTDEFV
ncbi:hypothetical protein FQR65_LT06792 [Abscondita terminalis]|nr:hypothetical protein FQR65_LT06792 [Abscondita terminalis]